MVGSKDLNGAHCTQYWIDQAQIETSPSDSRFVLAWLSPVFKPRWPIRCRSNSYHFSIQRFNGIIRSVLSCAVGPASMVKWGWSLIMPSMCIVPSIGGRLQFLQKKKKKILLTRVEAPCSHIEVAVGKWIIHGKFKKEGREIGNKRLKKLKGVLVQPCFLSFCPAFTCWISLKKVPVPFPSIPANNQYQRDGRWLHEGLFRTLRLFHPWEFLYWPAC